MQAATSNNPVQAAQDMLGKLGTISDLALSSRLACLGSCSRALLTPRSSHRRPLHQARAHHPEIDLASTDHRAGAACGPGHPPCSGRAACDICCPNQPCLSSRHHSR